MRLQPRTQPIGPACSNKRWCCSKHCNGRIGQRAPLRRQATVRYWTGRNPADRHHQRCSCRKRFAPVRHIQRQKCCRGCRNPFGRRSRIPIAWGWVAKLVWMASAGRRENRPQGACRPRCLMKIADQPPGQLLSLSSDWTIQAPSSRGKPRSRNEIDNSFSSSPVAAEQQGAQPGKLRNSNDQALVRSRQF